MTTSGRRASARAARVRPSATEMSTRSVPSVGSRAMTPGNAMPSVMTT